MLTDIKSGIQLVIFLLFLGALAYFGSQAIPAITQATSLPARIEAENSRVVSQANLERAQSQAQIIAVPTFAQLAVKGTESAIENERIKAQAQANAQVVAAQGSADLNRSVGDAARNLVLGIFGVIGALLVGRAALGVFLISRAEKNGGGVSVLPSGETRYFPASNRREISSGEHLESATRKRETAKVPNREDE